jgi:hypothetical protein
MHDQNYSAVFESMIGKLIHSNSLEFVNRDNVFPKEYDTENPTL